ncbi:amino acid adenylation domain-containing protein [Amycolatopsis sp. NPDC049252]|uniref:amino acid adenylation domain-containing protein n=1 Tax=Amycolatopsis sp. NPDC049252 TaxID=3363933 RepID=UPI003711AD84
MNPVPDREAPLSFEQERFYLVEHLGAGSGASSVAFRYLITGDLDTGALADAITELHRRHGVLRTRYPGVQRQLVAALPGSSLMLVDLRGHADPEAEAIRLAERSALEPFDLATAAPVRWTCFALGAGRHVLALHIHHIAIDAWSKTIIEEDLSALYGAFRSAAPLPPARPALSYADYATAQRAQDHSAELDHWVEHLGDLAGPTRLPFDHRPHADSGTHGARSTARLPDPIVAAAAALGRREHASLYMVLLSAFAWRLAQYGDQRDFVVGMPTGSRDLPELEPVVGCFVDTVPCRLSVPAAPTFRALLAHVRDATLTAHDHRLVSLARVVAALRPAREPGREPLVQVSFGATNAPAGGLRLPGLDVVETEREPSATELELTVIVAEGPDGVCTQWEYRTELFEPSTITVLQQDFRQLLEWALADPDRPLTGCPPPAGPSGGARPATGERAGRRSSAAPAGTLPAMFLAQVAKTPDAVAVSSEDEVLTYAELAARSERLARRLAGLGVAVEDTVGLLVARSAEVAVAEVAVVRAGAAYVPLDVRAPADRMRGVLAAAGCGVLLADRASAAEARQLGVARLLVIDEQAPEGPLPEALDPDNLAYVMYTSGSTGVPKGVAVRHRDVVARALDHRVGREHERVLLHSPPAFDASTYELWAPLLHGGQVVVAPPGDLDAGTLRQTITAHRVTGLWLTGGLFGLIARYAPGSLADVREVWTGGDVVPGAAVRRVLTHCPGTTVINGYGPTETTVFATAHEMRDARSVADELLIGRALDGTRVAVLDGNLRPVRTGVTGELYIAGAGLARGYLNRPALTAERFLPDPSGTDGARMYRSGDLAQWTGDGLLRFAGRSDDQLKIRGFRVEPGEVERALTACAGVAQAVVSAVERTPGQRSLVAYVVATPGHPEPTATSLRAALTTVLPDYMIPSAFVVLDEFPLTPNGKVDTRALPSAFRPEPGAGLARTGAAPRSEPERVVAKIWRELFELPSVGVEDGFFELGGHSLIAAQIVARLGELVPGLPTTGLMRDVLKYPTVAAFAARLADRMFEHATNRPAELPGPVPAVGRSGTRTLSLGQKRLWFLDQFATGSAEYVVPLVLRITGELDVAALTAALTEIVDRHEILRTSVVVVDDEPAGRVRPPGTFALARSVIGEAGLADAVLAEVSSRFDLAGGLPVRAALWRVDGGEDHLLCVTFHHMVFDGWSVGLFYDELEALYGAFAAGRPSPLPPLRVQYADVAAHQEAGQRGPAFEATLDFWRAELDGAQPFELIPDLPRPARRTALGRTRHFSLPEHVVVKLEQLARQHGATLFMTLLTAWQVLAHRYSGAEDLTVGTTATERPVTESESLIGFFITMLALRGDVSGNPAFGELLTRTRDRTLEAYAHQEVPFDRLVEELRPDRDLGRTPIFQVVVKLDSARQRTAALPGLRVRQLPPPMLPAKYDLEVALMRRADGLSGEITYDTGLYRPETIDRLVGHFRTLLADIAADPARPIDRLALMGSAERAEVRALVARPSAGFPDRCLHELVADQAARTPGAVAVVQDGRRLTYAELDAWSDEVAAELTRHGAGPDVVVGVLLDRSPVMVAALLGVLKAGSAYLPIEPESPPARIAELLADARSPVCLTEDRLADVVAAAGCAPLTVAAAGARPAGAGVPSGVRPGNLVAVYYTSGSTGKPKGVACTHAGWVNRIHWMGRYHPLAPGDTVLHKTTLTFDDAAVEIFWPLTTGATVALLGAGQHRDPRAIADAVIRYRAVHVQFVPSVLELFLDVVDERDAARMDALRSVLSSGEALRPALVGRFRERFGDRVVLDNTWGATEVSIDSTCRDCVAEDSVGTGAVSIGRPIDNNEVLVLDRRFDHQPIGAPGELCIGGTGLARGYLGDPRRTAEVFVPHPERAGERIYRTGDWGRLTADGSLTYLYRRDDQVKIRGVRVELGEVDHALRAHPAVSDAAVLAWTTVSGDRRLAAYVVATCTAKDVLEHLRARLSGYAVPSSVTVLEVLPRHANGKLNRRLLPEPETTESELDYVAPATATEEVLANIWAAVLERDRVGTDDDFFAIGGHSLLATRVIARMRQVFAVDLPVTLLFERPTVGRAAAAVEQIVLADVTRLTEEETRRLLD